MAVKIISGPEVKSTKCSKCGCTLEYTYNDIDQGKSTDYQGGSENYNFITCPCCKSKVTVKISF